MTRTCAYAVFAGLMLASLTAASAQEESQRAPQQGSAASSSSSPRRGEQNRDEPDNRSRLPADATTKHSLSLPGRTLNFSAIAGSVRLFNDKNEPQVDLAYTAYLLDGADPARRPVTFIFNGGPGSASAWLHLGDSGPWRLNMEGELSPSAAPELLPNAETWLDFTDLVFIDPAGTGYSRFVAVGDEARKNFFSVDGDARAIAVMINRWLARHDRLMSPKFVVGESYGGIRGPKVVRELETSQGIGVKGLILVSPVLDFREFSGSSILQYVASLPSMVAVARDKKGPVTRADLADVERYALGDFLLDLIKGENNVEASNRIADKFSALTGIDQQIARRLAGRFAAIEFRRELDRKNGRVAGGYDASVSGLDPYPGSSFFQFGDPSSDPITPPLTSAVVNLTRGKLSWKPDGPYNLFSSTANRNWDWGRGLTPAESVNQLRQIVALDPKLKVLVAHGLFDLVTPYFGSKIQLDQLPAFASPDRVKLVVYPGGHMFYSREASRKAFRAEAETLMK